MIELSVVIPVCNEENNIEVLYYKLIRALNKIKKSYEIIFVDDGSNDNSFKVIKKLSEKDKNIMIIQFQKNFGKSAALSSGFKIAKGSLIITMDGDLQDDPDEIPRFLEEIKNYDLVVGWKYKRKDPLSKRFFSLLFNTLVRLLIKLNIHDSNCGFKIYKKKVIDNINLYGELHRYIPALAYWSGFKVGEIKIKHYPRIYGKSKYGAGRLFKGFLDLITIKFLMTYGKRPLHLFGFIGFLCFLLGTIIGLDLTYLWFKGEGIGNRPLLMLGILLIVIGIQFVSLGLLGEMISSAQKKKSYIIKEEIS